MARPDAIIIGGGIIGGSLALELSREKLTVLVVERGQPGGEASWAAAGMLAPTSEHAEAPEMTALAAASATLYPSWVTRLTEQTRIDVGYRTEGTLLVARCESEAKLLTELPGERLNGDELHRLEPALSPGILAGLYLPNDHQVDNRRFFEALLQAARQSGVVFRSETTCTGLLEVKGRAAGVQLADGSKLEAGMVVNAAGSWAGHLKEVGMRFTPTRPIRGQMVMLASDPGTGKPLLRHVVRSPRGYLVPRADGRLLIGSTMEDAGYEKKVTPSGIAGLLAAGMEIAPGLAELAFVEAWSGLRPDTPDHLPILGATTVADYFVATGHFRNGILLAPITAKLLTEVMLGGKPSLSLEPFSPLRFVKDSAQRQVTGDQ